MEQRRERFWFCFVFAWILAFKLGALQSSLSLNSSGGGCGGEGVLRGHAWAVAWVSLPGINDSA